MAAKRRRAKKPEEPKKEPEKGSQPRRARVVLLLAALIVAAASIALFVWYPDVPGPGHGVLQRLTFTGKESPQQIIDRLVSQGLVRDARLFGIYFRARGGSAAPGPHLLPDDVSPRELVARLNRSGSPAKVTFPEGFTRFDMARRLEKNQVCDIRAFLDATIDPSLLQELGVGGDSAEGFLFPATYDLPKDSDPHEVVRTLVKTFDKRWSQLKTQHEKSIRDYDSSFGWERRQIVTLASMVEKEAAADDERALVASVLLNRLRDPKFTPRLLQCDPTAAYGCVAGAFTSAACNAYLADKEGKITHELLAEEKNPYNTYKHEGLPPGPIANPGEKSLQAALEPAQTKYLYFVAKGDKHHAFSETYAEHQAAIKPP